VSNSSRRIQKNLNQVIVPKERVVNRNQGCWNCTKWDREKANPLWTQKRQNDLAKALEISMAHPEGEDHVQVVNIRSMVDSLDHLVASGHVGVCTGGGRTANGEPVGDFVVHSFLCDRWNAMAGANLTREGGALDVLPEELADKVDSRTLVSDEMAEKGFGGSGETN
jgi:hypothetical protein